MAEKSGFFNARERVDGTYDREYDAEEYARYFANFISNGVYVDPADQLKVVYEGNPEKPFTLIVRKGKAFIDGFWYELTEDAEIISQPNIKPFATKSVVRLTLDRTLRGITLTTETNVVSDSPRNDGTIHDLVLATIVVQPNASKLNAEDIKDKRPDKTYCGFVTGVINQIDTTELFQQYDDAFQKWFNEMKDQLSTDAAGNLQNQIGVTDISDIGDGTVKGAIAKLNRNLSKHTHTVIKATTLSGTAVGSTRTISIPDLANWQEIRIMTEIGDESRMVHTIDRSIGTPFSLVVSGYASANYNGKMTVTVDWDNNAIKITPNRVAGWTVANLRITRVWGTIRI